MSVWGERRRRTVELLARQPHAEEILQFYGAVLEAQENVWRWALSTPGVSPRASPEAAVQALAPEVVQHRFQAFVDTVVRAAPRSLAEAGQRLLDGPKALRAALAVALNPGPEGPGASADPSDESPSGGAARGPAGVEGDVLHFFGSAFLEPMAVAARGANGASSTAGVATAASSSAVSGAPGSRAAPCRFCRRPPLLALLRDDLESRGRRWAVCGFCSRRWPTRRAECLGCGERDTERLLHHVGESLPHVRVEECRSCRTYHKTIDLRVDGRAVPIVDELASVELDLWAQERGLAKLQRNLLGL